MSIELYSTEDLEKLKLDAAWQDRLCVAYPPHTTVDDVNKYHPAKFHLISFPDPANKNQWTYSGSSFCSKKCYLIYLMSK